jgi:predicted dienelactone hydrolase
VVDYLTDVDRRDGEFPAGRPITLQLWYPASRPADSTAPYLAEPALEAALLRQRYYGVDSAALTQWASLPTHASVGAAPQSSGLPLLLFSVGLGVIRANYTSIAEELASRGYVVAVVESPLQGLMVTADDATVTDTIGRFEEPAAHRAAEAGWARDLSYALQQLLAGGSSDCPAAR